MGNETNRIKELIALCNQYRDAYYNHRPLVTDAVYDRYFDELANLEKETGIYFVNSPTQSVGYQVLDELPKVKHNIPLLSLDKSKDIKDIVKFCNDKEVLVMIKGDGLTTKITYKTDGEYAFLIEAATRGDGEVGSDVTSNVQTFTNVPKKIKYNKDLVVVGESVIFKDDFEKINASLPVDDQYSNCRNLASGSISLLNSAECAKRNMHFILFDVIEGMDTIDSLDRRFTLASELGFDVIYHEKIETPSEENLTNAINNIHKVADDNGIPCDGAVIRYDDYKYGLSLGRTGHHYKYGIAKKEEDDLVETVFTGIEWNTSRTGVVVPTGCFKTVEILDSKVSRATLHNLNYIDSLKLKIGDRICCSKRNMVIPAIEVNLDYSEENYSLPLIETCPSCGAKLEIRVTENTKNLYCPNEKCPARLLANFVHFVSKPCMNIDGLSEATLEKLIGEGFIKTYKDIYHLADYKREIINLEGFGGKSYNKLIDAIEKSRNVKLENFLNALGIPLIGKTASKTIAKSLDEATWDEFINLFETNFDFTNLEDFGKAMNDSLWDWYRSRCTVDDDGLGYGLVPELNFIVEEKTAITNDFIEGKVFVVTGAFNTMKRGDIEKIITDRGGKLSGSVSKKTSYLLTNDADSGSSKAVKAKELNIPIMSENEFIEKIK